MPHGMFDTLLDIPRLLGLGSGGEQENKGEESAVFHVAKKENIGVQVTHFLELSAE